jgi:hypothetical protein
MDPGLETEAAMTKVMLVVGLFAMFVLLDPMQASSYLGPQAAWLGYKISSAADLFPQISFFRGR